MKTLLLAATILLSTNALAETLFQKAGSAFATADKLSPADIPVHQALAGHCVNDAQPEHAFAGLLCLSRVQNDPLVGASVTAGFAYDDLGGSADMFTRGSLNYSPHPCGRWAAFRGALLRDVNADLSGGQMTVRSAVNQETGEAYLMLRSYHAPRGYVPWTSICWLWVDRTADWPWTQEAGL